MSRELMSYGELMSGGTNVLDSGGVKNLYIAKLNFCRRYMEYILYSILVGWSEKSIYSKVKLWIHLLCRKALLQPCWVFLHIKTETCHTVYISQQKKQACLCLVAWHSNQWKYKRHFPQLWPRQSNHDSMGQIESILVKSESKSIEFQPFPPHLKRLA